MSMGSSGLPGNTSSPPGGEDFFYFEQYFIYHKVQRGCYKCEFKFGSLFQICLWGQVVCLLTPPTPPVIQNFLKLYNTSPPPIKCSGVVINGNLSLVASVRYVYCLWGQVVYISISSSDAKILGERNFKPWEFSQSGSKAKDERKRRAKVGNNNGTRKPPGPKLGWQHNRKA